MLSGKRWAEWQDMVQITGMKLLDILLPGRGKSLISAELSSVYMIRSPWILMYVVICPLSHQPLTGLWLREQASPGGWAKSLKSPKSCPRIQRRLYQGTSNIRLLFSTRTSSASEGKPCEKSKGLCDSGIWSLSVSLSPRMGIYHCFLQCKMATVRSVASSWIMEQMSIPETKMEELLSCWRVRLAALTLWKP